MPVASEPPYTARHTGRLGALVIDNRFRGPPGSGNGGYTCGRMAAFIDGPATVRLMKPPPLDVHMDVVKADGEVRLMHGEDLVARAWPGGPDLDVPAAPALEAARARREAFAGNTRHAFPGCFVCGTERGEGDGLLIHAGPDEAAGKKSAYVACNWVPHASLCDGDESLAEHFVWAALDCPGAWAFLSFGPEVALLGELSAEISAPLHCGAEYIVAGWEIDRDGRKRHTGSAIHNAEGEVLARARATWITIPNPEQAPNKA